MSQIKQLVVAAVAGAATSFLAVAVLAPRLPAGEPEAAAKASLPVLRLQPDTPRAAASDVALRNKLSALEKRVQGIEADAHGAESERAAEAGDTLGDDPAPTAQQLVDRNEELFSQQPLDRAWAPIAETKLNDELRQMGASRSFALSDVECRNDACVATVEFPSYEKARERAGELASLPLSVNCAMGVAVPPPEDPSLPYSLRLFMTSCQKPSS